MAKATHQHFLVNHTERDIMLFDERPSTYSKLLTMHEGKKIMHEEESLDVRYGLEVQGDYWYTDDEGRRVKNNRLEISDAEREVIEQHAGFIALESEGKLSIISKRIRE